MPSYNNNVKIKKQWQHNVASKVFRGVRREKVLDGDNIALNDKLERPREIHVVLLKVILASEKNCQDNIIMISDEIRTAEKIDRDQVGDNMRRGGGVPSSSLVRTR